MADTASYICIAANSVGDDELPISTLVWVISDLRLGLRTVLIYSLQPF